MTTPQGRNGSPGHVPECSTPVTTGRAGRYEYTITPRALALGGGWQLRLVEDGVEIGGGVYPADEYADACTEAVSWLESRPHASALDPEPTATCPDHSDAPMRGLDVVVSDVANVVDTETRVMEWLAIVGVQRTHLDPCSKSQVLSAGVLVFAQLCGSNSPKRLLGQVGSLVSTSLR